MALEQRTRPCLVPGCKLPVLNGNDLWHVRYNLAGGYTVTMGHDLGVTAEDDIWEEIEPYD